MKTREPSFPNDRSGFSPDPEVFPKFQPVDAYVDPANPNLQVVEDIPYVLQDHDWQAVESDFGEYNADPPLETNFHPSLRDDYPPHLLDAAVPLEPHQVFPSEANDGSDVIQQQRRQAEYRLPWRSDHVRQIS